MSAIDRPSGRPTGVSAIFDPSKLTLARQLAGLRKADLAEKIGMAPASVSAWESGSQRPNEAAVARLCMALGVGPHFFSAGSSTASHLLPATPHFRSLRATSQRAQDQAYAYGRLASEVAVLLEKTVEFPAPNLPKISVDGLVVTPGAAESAAKLARQHLRLGPGPVPHLVRLMENLGVLVVFSSPQTASIDAFSFEGPTRPVIVLNPEKDDYYRQRMDVAHEFGHLVMHADAEPGGRVVEDQAKRFASEFLMPADEIGPLLPRVTTGKGWVTLAELKEHWGVSIAALLYRARALGVMSDVTYRNAMISVSQKGWRRAEPGKVSVLEMPSLLPRAVEVLDQAGISAEQMIRGPGLPYSLFRSISSRAPLRTHSS
jgi:Zn-dependent peptidase ImmA (M78 family)/transcriptional regulator with XRE-family HTH domain